MSLSLKVCYSIETVFASRVTNTATKSVRILESIFLYHIVFFIYFHHWCTLNLCPQWK